MGSPRHNATGFLLAMIRVMGENPGSLEREELYLPSTNLSGNTRCSVNL